LKPKPSVLPHLQDHFIKTKKNSHIKIKSAYYVHYNAVKKIGLCVDN